jgi:hypothetical protein
MQTSRVILANEPRLLRGMLRRVLARTPGLKVVGEVTDLAKLSSLVRRCRAQWVVVSTGTEGRVPSAVQSLLVEGSSLCILGMAADGSQAKILRTGSPEETREGLSLDDLVATLQRKR